MSKRKHRPVYAPGHKAPPPPPRPAPPIIPGAAPSPVVGSWRIRHIIDGHLSVLSPLHVGSGDSRVFAELEREAIDGEGMVTPEVAAIVRDHEGAPYLPGSTLKGLLRRIGEECLCQDAVTELFGRPHEDGSGTMGAVMVLGATIETPGDASKMPYAKRLGDKLRAGVFIAGRTRIDRARGIAEHAHLYFQEMVASGARFRLPLLLEVRRLGCEMPTQVQERASNLLRLLVQVLDRLTHADGQAIGKGQSSGQGRIRLEYDTLKITAARIAPNGHWLKNDATNLWWDREKAVAPAAGETFVLVCPGPFLVLDPSHEPAPVQGNEPTGPQLIAQRQGDRPLVLGSTILGALRSRAAWLEACTMLRAGTDPDPKSIDDPDLVLMPGEEIGCLSTIQRLFGVTGFRGLLEVRALDVTEGTMADFTSVRLDRFSGAPIDNMLFTSSTFVGTRIRLRLALSDRGAWPNDEDRQAFGDLLKDLRCNGIALGHSTNKGFGWFEVEQEAGA